ncbi:unnamed protein product [Camellia sinensis]
MVDLGISNDPKWTIISDKQKGLERAIAAAEHMHCMRHLHNNFKKDLKDMLWRLARATYVGKFNAEIQELKRENNLAYN